MRSRLWKRIGIGIISVVVLLGGYMLWLTNQAQNESVVDAFQSRLQSDEKDAIRVGDAFIRTSLDGTAFQGPQSLVYQTDNFEGPMQTADWWSSAAWVPFTGSLYPQPLTAKGYPSGLGIDSPEMIASPTRFHSLYSDSGKELLVGGQELTAKDVRVDGYGDWSVDLMFENKEKSKRMRVTLAHGSPYAYFSYEGTKPQVTFSSEPNLYYTSSDGAVLGVTVNDRHYGVFAPSGTAWLKQSSLAYIADTSSESAYLSVALLPDNSSTTIETFAQYAYNFITDTTVKWSYDEKKSTVVTSYSVDTKAQEGKSKGTIFALFPHQWKNTSASLMPYTYSSPRGTMKVVVGTSFDTQLIYRGILPYLPNFDTDLSQLNKLADELMVTQPLVKPSPEAEGTYWYGKNYGRLAQALPIVKQLGRDEDAKTIREAIQSDMEAAFSEQTNRQRIAYYDPQWGTINLYPTSFGADMVLNDHHFHYGYWVYAAAMLAYDDPTWVANDRYGSIIELLIRDYANWSHEDQSEQVFPFLRHFDPYEGHSWASGNAADGSGYSPGNNQESSSEAILAAAAMILWGDATGNREIRDAGIYLYTTEVESVRQYWYDVDGDNFPPDYDKSYVPLVFSSGGEYRTWWTNNPEEVRLINALPFTAASLYLGWDAANARENYVEMVAENDGPPQEWRDLAWMYEALFDSEAAMSKVNGGAYLSEYGESKLHTYQWISDLQVLGAVDMEVVADSPTYAAFKKGEKSTYIAFNSSSRERVVTFTAVDSGEVLFKLTVPASSVAWQTQ
ncbi:MAG: glycosyl hydrolase [Candidatus Cohnella colombiensis]|uniref:glucan endo-1,3-beta-D-glucosidase n=1 Tax=Candidatus Cohnella colombiensis TaxID=3121368 RepID=A0AA95JFS2_9BACL|nr:MAG: glycosyl hydrolase [Cohnella sp.]